MPYPSILAFIEGKMERFFFNTNFHYVRVVPLNNGKSVPVATICEFISSTYITSNINADAVIVWLDREGRGESVTEMREAIKAALEAAGAPANQMWVGVADRMSENWILADETMIKQEFTLEDYAYVHEGQNGKHNLRELFAAKGVNYKEMLHGTVLMKKMRLPRSALSSASAKLFLEAWPIECWWTQA